ncbi:MAG: tRNA pseudouridine(55) synthase TruB [Acidobacteria bacterium]|nr:tRNA pseudouridine(55) synthase TruB [Acidobacteriota bacterium]
MKRFHDTLNGALVIDKPGGMTSHDVVDVVRRAAGIRRVGHCGTLDPIATGLLVLLLGQATRLQRFLLGREKVYRATIRLGYATDTQDRTGKPLEPGVASNLGVEERLETVMTGFLGMQEQVAPMYSAKKVGGRPLYRSARLGEEVERKSHTIRVDALKLLPAESGMVRHLPDGTMELVVEVICSAGTYVRTLAHDLGCRLGCGGHLQELRRLRSGSFTLENAITLSGPGKAGLGGGWRERLIPMDQIDLAMPALALTDEEARSISHGQTIAIELSPPGSYVKMLSPEGGLLGIGEADAAGRLLMPRVVLD